MDVSRIRIGLALVLGVLLAVTASGAFDAVQPALFAPLVVIGPAVLLVAGRGVALRVFVEVLAVVTGVTLSLIHI